MCLEEFSPALDCINKPVHDGHQVQQRQPMDFCLFLTSEWVELMNDSKFACELRDTKALNLTALDSGCS